jgi:hypothetical protein
MSGLVSANDTSTGSNSAPQSEQIRVPYSVALLCFFLQIGHGGFADFAFGSRYGVSPVPQDEHFPDSSRLTRQIRHQFIGLSPFSVLIEL